MTITIPSIHYLAIVPVLVYFGAALALLLATALSRHKLSLRVGTATTVLASKAPRDRSGSSVPR